MFVLSSMYVLNLINRRYKPTSLNNVLFFSIISLIYIFLIVSLNEFKDTMGIKMGLQTVLYYMSGKVIYKYMKEKYEENWFSVFVNICSIIFLVNSIYVILVYFNSSFGNFAFQYLGGKNFEINNQLNNFTDSRRSFDMGTGSGAIASLNFLMIFILIAFEMLNKSKKIYIFPLIFIIIATSLLGRTGFYLELLISISIILFLFVKNIKSMKTVRFKSKNVLMLPFILIISILATITLKVLLTNDDKLINNTLPWLFEIYYNFIESGTLQSNTTNLILENMYFIPENLAHLLFGDSNLGRSSMMTYVPSDVGYIRNLFGFGILGSLFIYLPIVSLFIFSLKKIKFSPYKSITLALMILSLLIINFKELHLLFGNYSIIIFLVYFGLLDMERSKNEKIHQ